MPSPFYTARLAEWTQQVTLWPSVISCKGVDATVIRTPDRIVQDMESNNYAERVETTVDMLRSDYERLALAPQTTKFTATVSGEPVEYRFSEIVGSDENEPTIQIRAHRVMGGV